MSALGMQADQNSKRTLLSPEALLNAVHGVPDHSRGRRSFPPHHAFPLACPGDEGAAGTCLPGHCGRRLRWGLSTMRNAWLPTPLPSCLSVPRASFAGLPGRGPMWTQRTMTHTARRAPDESRCPALGRGPRRVHRTSTDEGSSANIHYEGHNVFFPNIHTYTHTCENHTVLLKSFPSTHGS